MGGRPKRKRPGEDKSPGQEPKFAHNEGYGMKQEWKPGDVALVTYYDPPKLAMVRPRTQAGAGYLEFTYAEGGYDGVASMGAHARPLVVIDPESADDIRRLASALVLEGATLDDRGVAHAGLKAALREFANPTPRIEEPTDPAVRVWANGSEWAKCGPWWVTPAVNELARDWDYLVEAVGFEVVSP